MDGAGAVWGRKAGPPDSYLEPPNPFGSPFFFGFQKPFFFLREKETGFEPSLPSLHVTERQGNERAYHAARLPLIRLASGQPPSPRGRLKCLLLQMTEILHGPAYSACNSMHFLYKYPFTAGKPPGSKSTGFCGNVDNPLWTIFLPFSPVWKPSKFVHHPCGCPASSLPRLSDAFPQYFILRVLFLSFILSSPQKRAEHERKGTHPHEVFL